MYKLNYQASLERNRDSQRGHKKYLVGAPNQRCQVSKESLLRFGAAVKRSKRVELAAWDNAIPGQYRAIVNRACSQIDPKVAVFAGPDIAHALGDARGGVALGIGVSVGFGLGAQIEQVEVDSIDGFFLLEVLLDDGVDG